MSYITHIVERDANGESVATHDIRDANAQGRIAALEAGIDDVVDAANAAAQTATTAAATATDAAGRAEDAIAAVTDMSEQAVPLMSADTRGGARLDPDGGLELEDGALGVGSLVREGDGAGAGPLAGVTARGWSEQASTTGKNLLNIHTTVRKYGDWSNTTVRSNIDGDGVWIGITANNYFASQKISSWSVSGDTLTVDTEGGGYGVGFEVPLEASTEYHLSVEGASGNDVSVAQYTSDGTFVRDASVANATFTSAENVAYGIVVFRRAGSNNYVCPQLELGTTATAYEPYTGGEPSPSPDWPQEIRVARGHEVDGMGGRYIDLEVTHDGTTTTTPIPLPSRGWAGALPDGTADALTVDVAGGVGWELGTNELVLDGSVAPTQFQASHHRVRFPLSDARYTEDGVSEHAVLATRFINGTKSTIDWMNPDEYNVSMVGDVRYRGVMISQPPEVTNELQSKAWFAEHPTTVLYPLATPTTEHMGYVDLPDVPEGSTVSIPELDALGVSYYVDGGAIARASRQWYERLKAELTEGE